jgi:hypothetical protein
MRSGLFARIAKRDAALIVAFLAVAYFLFRQIDPVEMLIGNIHPWDSWHYLGLSDQMIANGFSGLSELRPFCYRLVQPALATMVRLSTGATYSEASHAINVISTILVTLFCFNLWRRLGLSKCTAFVGVVLLSVSWLGPLRYSIYYPGGQFAFEVLMTCVSFWALKKIYSCNGIIGLAAPSLVLFAATLGRENTAYLVIINVFYLLLSKVKSSNGVRLAGIASIGSSLLGYFAARQIVAGEGEYSVVKTVLAFGWFHLNIAESLYMYFYAFGALFLVFLLCISFEESRKELALRLQQLSSLDNKLIVGFCLASFIFAFVGGTDSDRFLLWALPFYFYLGLSSLEILFTLTPSGRYKNTIFSILLISAILSSRVHVPAIPHLMFTSKFNAQAGVKTNLNPDLYRGVPFLPNLRKKLIEIPASDAYSSERIGDSRQLPKAYVSQKIAVAFPDDSGGRASSSVSMSPYVGSYRLAVNNVPFPLGFAHNQNELLAIHPYHGDLRLRALLLAQWISIYLILTRLICTIRFKLQSEASKLF